jgi:hypothetical protein
MDTKGFIAEHSKAKLELYSRYLRAYLAVLLTTRKFDGIVVHDIFAGPGVSANAEKVVAFDLATLAMTIEGRTHLPGFIVHDSPREADLGRSIYHRLFGFARRLEAFGTGPLFQYIVTTTTEPPEEFRSAPWLRLTIKGAPAEERLLGVDL